MNNGQVNEIGLYDVTMIEAPSPASNKRQKGVRAWLYDLEARDAPLDTMEIRPAELTDKQILWVDVDVGEAKSLDPLWARLGVERVDLSAHWQRPSVVFHDDLIELTVNAIREHHDGFVPIVLHCLVGRNWIATVHEGELNLVEDFNEPLANENQLGRLDAAAFLSVVLDWHLNGYFRTVERLQGDIDKVDEELLNPEPTGQQLLERLYRLRRQVTKLRLTLGPHRDVFGPLSNPHTATLSDGADFERLLQRLESALLEVNTAREMIAVSFDIYMAELSQDTNDIMKRLTLISVLLLPSVVLAGIMGMNFKVGLFDAPWMFWVIVVTMVLMAGLTLFLVRRRKWL